MTLVDALWAAVIMGRRGERGRRPEIARWGRLLGDRWALKKRACVFVCMYM